MNRLSVFAVASVAALAAACTTAPSKPASAPTAAPAAKAAPAAINLTGTWKVVTDTQQGPLSSDMTVTQTGDKFSGKLTSQMGSVDYSGTITGDTVKFGFTFEAQGNSIPIEYNGKVNGDSMTGDATFGTFGSGAFTAKRAQ